MKILVVGGGGREHAIIRKLKESPLCGEIWCAPGNGGISYNAHCKNIKATDLDAMVAFAKEEAFDYAVVAQDDPLALGMVDRLAEIGIPSFGPNAAAARIEASKVFSKDLMRKYHIPTADYAVFDDPAKALAYITEKGEYPTVIKADGLALGKGVLICEDEASARDGLKEIMEDKKFGASGNRVVVEEFLTGPEVSVLSFTDGKVVKPMVSSMDHKRALDGDKGLNTGGMGTVAPNPYYTPEVAQQCMETIFLPTIEAMQREGCPFKGCLYFGLMLTPKGPKVIEYNCRFGDPETQVVLPLLESDLLKIMLSTTNGTLADTEVTFSNGAAACVVMASGGYPEHYEKGKEITGLTEGQISGSPAVVYHAGTALTDGKLVTNGGRVLGVTATGDTLPQALEKAYAACESIHFEGAHKRNDIGQRALKALL
ncbi:MAG: phosphoribosylamine--glycine ligase [Oscillospiraceae bacterium]|nr:phosphoribosylamine--glycine ligase [Bacteroidales bacterium]MDD6998683.1 phosphoribosylamine--glycine ligase [Oscillospiraceae bacterium]MDY5095087.1 phosphoribosylamine--glycine ligase [Oscillospiraceae bacterium]